jgi:hypothetical protein
MVIYIRFCSPLSLHVICVCLFEWPKTIGVKRFEKVRGWYEWLIYERELERLESVQLAGNGQTAELSVERGPRKILVHINTISINQLNFTL